MVCLSRSARVCDRVRCHVSDVASSRHGRIDDWYREAHRSDERLHTHREEARTRTPHIHMSARTSSTGARWLSHWVPSFAPCFVIRVCCVARSRFVVLTTEGALRCTLLEEMLLTEDLRQQKESSAQTAAARGCSKSPIDPHMCPCPSSALFGLRAGVLTSSEFSSARNVLSFNCTGKATCHHPRNQWTSDSVGCCLYIPTRPRPNRTHASLPACLTLTLAYDAAEAGHMEALLRRSHGIVLRISYQLRARYTRQRMQIRTRTDGIGGAATYQPVVCSTLSSLSLCCRFCCSACRMQRSAQHLRLFLLPPCLPPLRSLR